jgi:hypothetical protein
MQVQTTADKLVIFGASVDSALDTQHEAQQMIKAQWRASAEKAIDLFGCDWLHFAMLSKRDVAIAKMAKAEVERLKAENAETAKTLKEYAQGIKAQVVERVKARSENGGNPREQYSRFLAYCVEVAGLARYEPREKAPGTGSGTTSYDKVAEALRVLRNHLPQCEPQAVENLLGVWEDIEQAALEDGILKEQV